MNTLNISHDLSPMRHQYAEPLWKRRLQHARPLSLACALSMLTNVALANSDYDYAVLAASGSAGFTGFGDRPSINAQGAVAFVGVTASGESVYVVNGPGQPARQVAFQSGAVFGRAALINDACDVLARNTVTYVSALKTWSCNGSGLKRVVAMGAYPSTHPYSVVNTWASINNLGKIAFSARPYSSNPSTTLLVTDDGGASQNVSFTGNLLLYPRVSDSGHVVLRTGNLTSDPIRLYTFNLLSSEIISVGFSSVGRSPGIGDDDSAVGFCGDRGSGAGVFLSLKGQAGGRSILRVVGENNGTGGPNPELGTNASGAPIYFASFDTDSRVGLVQFASSPGSLANSSLLISFVGTPNAVSSSGSSNTFTNMKGLWVARVDFDATSIPRLTGVRPCIQIGDPIGAATLLDIGVFDPISKIAASGAGYLTGSGWDHRVAFWASTTAGSAIVRAESIEAKVTLLQATKEVLLYSPDDGIEDPLKVKPDFDLLQRQPPVSKGLVADGVTPLLIQFRLLHPPTNSTAYTIALQTNEGTISNLADHLWVLSGDGFVRSNQVFLSTSYPTGFCYISGIKSEALTLNPGVTSAKVEIAFESAPGTGCPQQFEVAKPPIVLVHGYGSDQTTWSDGFMSILSASRPPSFVQKVEYGVKLLPNGKRDNTENTAGPFRNLAWLLNNSLLTLESPSTPLRTNWAFTRYSIVAHSQGGLLCRFLSLTDGPTWQRASSSRTFYRSRFERVITLNSPHNGSVIPYYLNRRGGLVPWILKNLLREKFSPFGDQVVAMNALQLDPRVRFHTIRTTLAGGQPPSLFNCAQPYPLIGKEFCLPFVGSIILPRGSDGIVDFDSMSGGPATKCTTITGRDISHCPPELIFGVSPDSTATRSGEVAKRVATLLDGPDLAFGQFENPANLDPVRKAQIDVLATTFKIVGYINIINKVISKPGRAPKDGDECFSFRLEPRDTEPLSSDIGWYCEAYGADGVTQAGLTVTPDTNDVQGVRVCVDTAVRGTVVLYGSYLSTNQTIVYATPVVVTDRPMGSNMVDIAIEPSEVTLSPGDALDLVLWGVFDNGQVGQLYIPNGFGAVFTSSDNTVATVTAASHVQLMRPGNALISVSYLGFSKQSSITVVGAVMDPQLAIAEGSSPGEIVLTLTGSAGRRHIVELSNDLSSWHPFYTNNLPVTGSLVISDLKSPGVKAKFYRASMTQ